jgi:hypothetical protein
MSLSPNIQSANYALRLSLPFGSASLHHMQSVMTLIVSTELP